MKNELGAAWAKQMRTKDVVVLPILYRDCEIPPFLEDRRYGDFRSDYNSGFAEIAQVLGIEEGASISRSNWRLFAKARSAGWQKFRDLEFEELVTALVNRAREYNWSSWVGRSKNPYSLALYAFAGMGRNASISLKIDRRTFAYMASLKCEHNPNNLKSLDFDMFVGTSVNECEEFVWRYMDNYRKAYGDPTGKAYHSVHKHLNAEAKLQLAENFVKELSWYKGEKLL